MPKRTLNNLTVKFAQAVTRPGLHSDGGGLYLRVDPTGAKRWAFIFHWRGRRCEMSLGSQRVVSLAEARLAAAEVRQTLFAGKNPIEERRAKREAPTFGNEAESLIAALAPTWKHPDDMTAQWRGVFTLYAGPIWTMRVDEVTTQDILRVLKPIWTVKQETASKLRGRIERVLDAATAKGLRAGDNPARWQGHLIHLLAPRQKLTHGHRKALDYREAPSFMKALALRNGAGARALEFTILTAARENEVLGATWREIDFERKVWTVPAARMKTSVDHQVPLSTGALAILGEPGQSDELIFEGARGRQISNATMDVLLKRMKVDVTVHGFRSTFRDWAGDETEYPREVAEAALSHKVGDSVEQAYRRSTALERRRSLMTDWSAYLGRSSDVRCTIAA